MSGAGEVAEPVRNRGRAEGLTGGAARDDGHRLESLIAQVGEPLAARRVRDEVQVVDQQGEPARPG